MSPQPPLSLKYSSCGFKEKSLHVDATWKEGELIVPRKEEQVN